MSDQTSLPSSGVGEPRNPASNTDADVLPRVNDKPATAGFQPIRLLYSENPFYVISCGLVIYGVQLAAGGQPTLLGRSLALGGGMLAYASLMAVTVILIVRVAKVWQDARSIFLIVALSLAAYTIGYDEISLASGRHGWAFAALGASATLLLTETILRACRLRLPASYRTSYYAIFGVLLIAAPVAADWVRERLDDWANASPLIFSLAIAMALLPLIPAMRRRSIGLRHHGSPWRFPLYPLSLFVVLLVIVCIRTHAVWMAFSPRGGAVGFEPFLLVPITAAVLLLIGEVDLHRRKGPRAVAIAISVLTPAILLLLVGEPGRRCAVPINPLLESTIGSMWNATLILIGIIELYHWASGNLVARTTLAVLVGFGAITAQVPAWTGLSPLAIGLIGGGLILLIYWSNLPWDFRSAVAVAGLAAAAAWYADRSGTAHPAVVGVAMLVAGSLLAGAYFDTPIGHALRQIAAVMMVAGVLWSFAAWQTYRLPLGSLSWLLGTIAGVATGYIAWTRRRGWIAVALFSATMLVSIHAHRAYRRGAASGLNLPLAGGAVCFVAGLAVTISKARPDREPNRGHINPWARLRPGL